MIQVYIEVESGSKVKYLYDERTFVQKGTRELLAPYPYPYGFIIGTETDDGEAVDAYIITSHTCKPGTTVDCEPVGLLEMFEGDEVDHKVVATIPGEGIRITGDLRDELEVFIQTVFKAFPDVHVRVGELLPAQAAIDHIRNSQTGQVL